MMAGTSASAPIAVPEIGPRRSGPVIHAKFYSRYLLFIAGKDGLLYGIDVGIIAAALL
jgi:hypothetical protein